MQFVRRLLSEQRKRAVASIMSAIESTSLAPREQQELRSKVLASLNQYHDTTLDVLKSSVDTGAEVNEAALQLIAQFNHNIHEMRIKAGGQ